MIPYIVLTYLLPYLKTIYYLNIMNTLAIRVKLDTIITINEVKEYFKEIPNLSCYELGHKNNQPHIHIYAKSEKSIDTFRKHMNSYLNPNKDKNSTYCRKDKGNYLSYTYKEKKVIMNTLFTEKELSEIPQYTRKELREKKTHADIMLMYVPLKEWKHKYEQDDHIDKYIISSLNTLVKVFNPNLHNQMFWFIKNRHYKDNAEYLDKVKSLRKEKNYLGL